MSEAEREKYVAWWLYESGLEVDDLIEIATMLAGGTMYAPLYAPHALSGHARHT